VAAEWVNIISLILSILILVASDSGKKKG